MRMSNNDTAVIIEYFDDKFKQIAEVMNLILVDTKKIPAIASDVKTLKEYVKVIKKAVKDTNTDLKLLDRRVTKLETA